MNPLNQLSLEEFRNFFFYYMDKSHQRDAVEALWKEMPVMLLEETAEWIQIYRTEPEEQQPDSVINDAGLALIKEFEGLRLEAYLCPAGVPTIGYGHTGDDVWLGKVISEPEAEALLRQDLWRFEDCISSSVHVTLTDNEYAALVSWCFNIGCGAAKSSTLVRRLNAYEDKERVIREELPRWNKGGGGVLPGLVRRREAEIALAVS